MELKDKTAVITGGANGIGRATTLAFIREGASVMIWDIDAEQAAETKRMAGNGGDRVHFLSVDIRSYEKVEAAIAETASKIGKIDILINNAGVTSDATLKKMTPENWQKVIDVNLTGVFNCGKAAALHMMENNYGRIINTSSVVAHNGNFGQSNYVASKTGAIGLAKVWAKELGRYNITVNAVAPGFVETDMIKTVPEKVLDGLRGQTPLGRLGKPEDIANAYVYLSSEKASFITGAVLNVDGGLKL